MSWRRHLQEAEFRGAKFKVSLSDTGVGRRITTHPGNRQYPKVQDHGQDFDEFEIEGYVIQNSSNAQDYFNERDALIEALLKEKTDKKRFDNPGKLVHPYYGTMQVHLLEKARIVETFEEGGMARFTMKFIRHKEEFFSIKTDYLTAVDIEFLNTVNSALDTFTDWMDYAGAFVSTLTSPIQNLMTNIQGAISSVTGAIGDTISNAIGLVSTAIATIDSVLNTPCALGNTIMGAADSVQGLVGLAGEVVQGGIIGSCSGTERGDTVVLSGTSIPSLLGTSVVENLINISEQDEDDITTIPDEQSDNLALVVNINQAALYANAIKIAIRIDYNSYEEMEDTMNLIADSMDNFLLRLGDQVDNTFDNNLLHESAENMRSVFISSMLDKNAGLVKQVQYTVPVGVISTLELAYNQYEDIDRSDEIFERNRIAIRHPGFLPSGDEIGILHE